jgi:hypothetical protein
VITLSNNGRLFPYEKAVVLNAIYDALDARSFVIDRANSVRGTLFVSSKTFPEMNGRIAITPTLSGEQTLVEILTDDGAENQSEWINALMDEAQSLIRRAEKRETK